MFLILCLCLVAVTRGENPCAARQVPGESVVCVCNNTYCDDFIRAAPEPGTFVAYTSSKDGSRFFKSIQYLQSPRLDAPCPQTLTLQPETQFQTIEGFGGAVTDSAAMNWKSLSTVLQSYLIRSYFSDKGLEYNMLRVPIGGSDFSTRPYSYNEYPVDDPNLTNYTLAKEDIVYKIPMIKEIFSSATADVHIVSSVWSPPLWMKNNKTYIGANQLLPKYFQTYADYHLKFLERYSNEGVPIWAITTTNEPTNGLVFPDVLNCLGWLSSSMGTWISKNLGPTIRNSSYKDIKILALDDQRYNIPAMLYQMLISNPEVLDYIDGVAVHYYGDKYTPPCILTQLTRDYPDKFILGTEACEGAFSYETEKVKLGSWERAVSYITDMITDFNNNLVGWMDWNLCLNSEGGPTWVKNYVDSPIIVFPDENEFVKQPMFYAMGHFSKFVPRGSKRIQVKEEKALDSDDVKHVAFLTPRNTVVAVIYNGGNATTIGLNLQNNQAIFVLKANCITTVEMPYCS